MEKQVKYGINASTTGNIYGIYDMSGGSYEYTAAYVNNGNSNLTTNGASLVSGDAKYKDVYEKGTSDTQALNYAANSSKKGDAVYETSSSYTDSTSGFVDQSFMVYSTRLFFIRGGYYNAPGYTDSGIFAFYGYYGSGDLSYIGFRPVLVLDESL